MHVLTKLFIVLVALLSVVLVPLVVVYAHNENSFQARYQDAEAKAAALSASFEAAKANLSAETARKDNQIGQLESLNLNLRQMSDSQQAQLLEVKADLDEATNMDAQIRTDIAKLADAVQADQSLTESLIAELRGLRREALASERQKVELDDALRDREAQLDAAVEARRALQEELQRLKDEHAIAMGKLGQYASRYPDLEITGNDAVSTGLFPDKALDCSVISVRRNADQTLAEIDAGSRDGVQRNWLMTVGRDGNFVGRLRIIEVDINRSTGVLELENGSAQPGDHVYARPN